MKCQRWQDYPRRLSIGHRTYHVRFGIYNHQGCTYKNSGVIEIDKRLPPLCMFETLVHEVLHAIEFEYQIKLSHKMVYALEKPIAHFILNHC